MPYWRDVSLGGVGGTRRLFGSGIPIIIPSSGIIGNNGALSAITALPFQYPSCYMYFPANAIEAGSAAGFYYVVMSSTTAGTIYNSTYTSGTPSIPTSPTAFTTTGPGAYTQTTVAQITLFASTVPGGAMGLNGTLSVEADYAITGSTNAKTMRLIFGGQIVHQIAQSSATSVSAVWMTRINNRGHASRQYIYPSGAPVPSTSSASNLSNTNVNTDADVAVSFTGELANAAEFIILHGFRASIIY